MLHGSTRALPAVRDGEFVPVEKPLRRLGPTLLAVSLASGCAESAPARASGSACPPGGPPDVALRTIDGGTFRLADHYGRHGLVLVFWMTWSDPSKQQLVEMSAQARELADRVKFIAVAADGPQTVAQVRSEAAKLHLSFPVVIDEESQAAKLYNPRAVTPHTVLVDRCGQVVEHHDGHVPGLADDLAAAIERLQ